MKFLVQIAVLFYVVFIMFVCSMVLLSLYNLMPYDMITDFVMVMKADPEVKQFTVGVLAVILLFNFVVYNRFSPEGGREKVIAFDNPAGRVSVSLAALEDLIKRLITRQQEIRESKSMITVGKKGLFIRIKVILRSESNIPELTSRIQEMVKSKIQDIIGLEEPVYVTIHVGKILPEHIKSAEIKKSEDEYQAPPHIPFHGYRA